MKIEDIILGNNRNGISKLRKYLPDNFCEKATKSIIRNLDRTIIITGFYVNGQCDLDGLSGSIHVANVLGDLGSKVTFVSDKYCVPILQKIINFPIIDFPIGNQNSNFTESIIKKINPTLIISVDRCDRSKNGRYYNFKGNDITNYTAKLDLLISKIPHSVAIGDVGNEIGMGNLYLEIKKEKIFLKPSITKAEYLVISSTANWGCYGIIAYLSKFLRKDYLSEIKDDELIKKLVSLGCIDGITRKKEPTVDGYTLDETKKVIKDLNSVVFD